MYLSACICTCTHARARTHTHTQGEALKSSKQPAKCLKEYVVPGPKSSGDTRVDGELRVSVASIIPGPNLFAEAPRVFGGFVGGITYSYPTA